MPSKPVYFILFFFIYPILPQTLLDSSGLFAYEGIQTFYIRYDVKSSNNKIIDDYLIMVPAENEFRAEKFSRIVSTGVISSDQESLTEQDKVHVRNTFIKSILVKHGLKSVKAKDYDTVLSYEGVIVTPVSIIEKEFKKDQTSLSYEASAEFSPIAFPDQWKFLDLKYKVKEGIYRFFELFSP